MWNMHWIYTRRANITTTYQFFFISRYGHSKMQLIWNMINCSVIIEQLIFVFALEKIYSSISENWFLHGRKENGKVNLCVMVNNIFFRYLMMIYWSKFMHFLNVASINWFISLIDLVPSCSKKNKLTNNLLYLYNW